MNVDGTGEKALTNNRVYEGLPDWSPDGRRIVLAGEGGTYVMNSNGTEKRALHRYGSYPAWSPDGKKILFASETDDYIAAINPDGSGLTYISRTPHMDVNFELDWQPLPRTVHQPDTGGLSLLLAASALLISGGVMFYAGLKRRM
jgi:hypothetical protein